MLNEAMKYIVLYCVCENFCDSILLLFGTGSGTVINYGTGSAAAKSYGSYNAGAGSATTLLIL
jgi:hypothetical protein